MKRRNHIGFLNCYRCNVCGKVVNKNGSVLSASATMEFSEEEYANAERIDSKCCRSK